MRSLFCYHFVKLDDEEKKRTASHLTVFDNADYFGFWHYQYRIFRLWVDLFSAKKLISFFSFDLLH